jgi:hypothetical protein
MALPPDVLSTRGIGGEVSSYPPIEFPPTWLPAYWFPFPLLCGCNGARAGTGCEPSACCGVGLRAGDCFLLNGGRALVSCCSCIVMGAGAILPPLLMRVWFSMEDGAWMVDVSLEDVISDCFGGSVDGL